ncbi:MAG: RDD family protein [Chloroflexi bacterium]|nr:RDD family protein [Chloroflexota bacterium]
MTVTSPSPAPGRETPSTGLIYADVPNRVVAYIIDAIIVGIIGAIVGGILGAIGIRAVTVEGLAFSYNYGASIIQAIAGLIISGVYFVYLWTHSRATLGMRALGLQIGSAGSGATMSTEQAVRRFLLLAGPGILVQVFFPLPVIGLLLPIAALAWLVFLLYTTATSPTKQGFHDTLANTQVVKAVKTLV